MPPENPSGQERPQSRFARMLAADPELRARCDAVRQMLQDAAMVELQAVYDSELLTAEDFGIVINARAANY